ncbi:tetratricopeptide repeat protein [Vulgatibacter incomptus]|uniref:FecR protein domain-containing protein n=1 Tax=Vulgatibacter incomptus TaxID=1391653 RepID=A0A0K1PCP1_9BACT|nr:tetratricopeptide repeat protein [Vulgatibacter incomptus]AKU91186.1 hypothetical protein AKJ08_1573 [Vulgatibacter incomptus]
MRFPRPNRHPSPVELSRALSEGADRKLEEHLSSCASCAATWSDWGRVDVLARQRTVLPVSSERRAMVLDAILATTAEPSASVSRASVERERPLWLWGALAGAAVAAAVAIVLVGRSDPPPAEPPVIATVYRGTVRPHDGARFVRVSSAPDEVVRLYEGTISVDVEPLRAGERFRVVVGDGQVEVRGTSFDVEAVGDALSSVKVEHGVVDVNPGSRPTVVLLDGQRWDAKSEGAAGSGAVPIRVESPSAKERRGRAPPPVESETTAVSDPVPDEPPPRSPMAELFDRGWTQLRSGRPREAAQTFEEALAKHPSDPLAEDAAFWRGVSLARAKRTQEASRALAAFIDAHPTSHRAGEASVMLGWILLERREIDAAEARFRAAVADPVEAVRASAEKGLEAARATRRTEDAPR